MENGKGTVDVGDCIASVSGQAMAAEDAWDGKLEVEDNTETKYAFLNARSPQGSAPQSPHH